MLNLRIFSKDIKILKRKSFESKNKKNIFFNWILIEIGLDKGINENRI